MKNIKNIIKLGLILFSIDFVYLKSIGSFFNKKMKLIQKEPFKLNKFGALLCYLFLILGLYHFVIKNIDKNTVVKKQKSLIKDAFILGFVIYGVFETTNYAIFKNWSVELLILDTIWGGILFSLTTYIYLKLYFL